MLILKSPLFQVFFYALLTALATGLGALPFAFRRQIDRQWLGYGNGMAAGLMLAASFQLVQEGISSSIFRTVLGLLAGLLLIGLGQRRLNHQKELHIGHLKGMDARRALLLIGVMTVHSFAEGIGVGVSFSGGQDFGAYIALAIAVHNIPEGLAISIVLAPRGMRTIAVAGWCILTSLPQPFIAVPSFMFVDAFAPLLPLGLGVAAGAMIWMVAAEIIPDGQQDSSPEGVATATTLAVAAMVAFQAWIH